MASVGLGQAILRYYDTHQDVPDPEGASRAQIETNLPLNMTSAHWLSGCKEEQDNENGKVFKYWILDCYVQ